jgi:hypothetical protein
VKTRTGKKLTHIAHGGGGLVGERALEGEPDIAVEARAVEPDADDPLQIQHLSRGQQNAGAAVQGDAVGEVFLGRVDHVPQLVPILRRLLHRPALGFQHGRRFLLQSLYTTGSSTDYSVSSSLHGGPNQYAYQPFNTATNSNVSGAITMTNITINT